MDELLEKRGGISDRSLARDTLAAKRLGRTSFTLSGMISTAEKMPSILHGLPAGVKHNFPIRHEDLEAGFTGKNAADPILSVQALLFLQCRARGISNSEIYGFQKAAGLSPLLAKTSPFMLPSYVVA